MKKFARFSISFIIALLSADSIAKPNNPPVSEPTPVVQQMTTTNKTADKQNQVNINTADAAEIKSKLVGIGEKKAQAIVDYRTKNGAFITIEQLTEVSGIGKTTLEKNRERITLE
ncbi:DNA uptake protein and related DNA-binding protein [Actinobacillus pleuropneumoniae]|uniref:ComEA family DNA-binding protein n=1 Tax=Actinobacillus pleuropneumoniae TaxID=715 RepID=UPI0001E4A11E|nr:ComEA family DNA-binding protein [Actinobacillus pleuropneumoniae]EFM89393.1 DNA uptake protein [Actinobacillus pleuropneumoniae serovar 4 str. M62]UKH41627.1 helix-hairpin-helix domain-containing protein [Actinobacillus pleuropneumoniae serovar 4 str. M62]SQF65197.1 DNA uptake protein and related DNA-binding protein [Actinobacillus pleuropneumoniae]